MILPCGGYIIIYFSEIWYNNLREDSMLSLSCDMHTPRVSKVPVTYNWDEQRMATESPGGSWVYPRRHTGR